MRCAGLHANKGKHRTNLGQTYNLGQIQGIIADSIEDQVLEFVDRSEEVVAEGSHFRKTADGAGTGTGADGEDKTGRGGRVGNIERRPRREGFRSTVI